MAVLGTALGDEHVQILKRFADRVVLVLDGDEAGQKRTNEVLELFVAQQVDLRILTLPEASRPVRFPAGARRARRFATLLDNEAVDALEHAFRVVHPRAWTSSATSTARARRWTGWSRLLAKAPRPSGDADRFREEKILSRLAQDFACRRRTSASA